MITALASSPQGRCPVDDKPKRFQRRGAGEERVVWARPGFLPDEPTPNIWIIDVTLINIDPHRADNLTTGGGQMGAEYSLVHFHVAGIVHLKDPAGLDKSRVEVRSLLRIISPDLSSGLESTPCPSISCNWPSFLASLRSASSLQPVD